MIRRLAFGAILLVMVVVPVWGADSTYRHPLGFSILVPAGWQTDLQQSGMTVKRGPAYVGVMVVEGTGAPAGLLDAIVASISKQWKDWQPMRRESCNLAGMAGACGWYSGVDRKGEAKNLKVAAGGKEGKGYVLFVAAPRPNYGEFSRDLDAIERSFSLGGGDAGPSSSVKQQLEALDKAYQSGGITTEQYQSKRNALLGR